MSVNNVTIIYTALPPGRTCPTEGITPFLPFPFSPWLCDNVLLSSPWLLLHVLSFEELGSYPWEGQPWLGRGKDLRPHTSLLEEPSG